MKKILSVLLVLACILSVAACDRNGDNGASSKTLETFARYLEVSSPTKSETNVKQTISTTVLESTFSITTGTIDGKVASIYEEKIQKLNDVETLDLNYISEESARLWYYEGKGTSTNKGRTWNPEGTDFAPGAGSIAIDLSEGNFTETEYDEATETLVLHVSKDKAKTVLANLLGNNASAFNYGAVVTLVAAGGRISSIKVEYTIDPYEIGEDFENMIEIETINVVFESKYSYDIQDISFE